MQPLQYQRKGCSQGEKYTICLQVYLGLKLATVTINFVGTCTLEWVCERPWKVRDSGSTEQQNGLAVAGWTRPHGAQLRRGIPATNARCTTY